MNKKLIGSIVLAIIFGLGMGIEAFAGSGKVGYVNLSLVFDSYEKTKNFDVDLQKEAEEKRADRDALVDKIKTMRDEMELLSPDSRAEKQQSIDQLVQELQAFDRDSRLELRRKRDTMIREILQEIDEIVQAYGDKEGYDYIYNDRILLYKKDKNDLSQEIINRLNASN